MTSKVAICNKALTKLGASLINSLDEGSENADTLNAVYDTVRDAELRKHPWNFAIKRVELAASGTEPLFGYQTQYPMPTDCLRILPTAETNTLDWKIEGQNILTNDAGAMELVYVSRETDTEKYDSAFVDALACALAVELCERRTQSNQKAVQMREDYKASIREARKVNAFENTATFAPIDSWLTARY